MGPRARGSAPAACGVCHDGHLSIRLLVSYDTCSFVQCSVLSWKWLARARHRSAGPRARARYMARAAVRRAAAAGAGCRRPPRHALASVCQLAVDIVNLHDGVTRGEHGSRARPQITDLSHKAARGLLWRWRDGRIDAHAVGQQVWAHAWSISAVYALRGGVMHAYVADRLAQAREHDPTESGSLRALQSLGAANCQRDLLRMVPPRGCVPQFVDISAASFPSAADR